MHTMWKGSISFGLVNVPVRMFAATESKDVTFRYLHKTCRTPIKYQRVCPNCDKPVEWDEIVRGYEYEPDRYILIEEDDFKDVQKTRSHTIDIMDFVELSQIDPVYYDKTYYLSPEAAGAKAYRLLEDAMKATGKIAIAKTVLRNAETLACLRVYGNVLVMETLFWPDEVRATSELPGIGTQVSVTDQELSMATTLISQLATEFNPEKYRDERREKLLDIIQEKVEKEGVTPAPVAASRRENIVDLMQALQESIKMTKPPTKRRTKRTS